MRAPGRPEADRETPVLAVTRTHTGSSSPDADLDPDHSEVPVPVGTVLRERYEILEHIGAGGMGSVYAARDLLLDTHVALKLVRGARAGDPRQQARLWDEILLAQTITHPNVIRTFTLELHGDQTFIVMELLRGRTLRDRLRAGRIEVGEAVEITRGILAGLAAAHAKNILHRDVKPHNVELCDDGRVGLMDFGIARTSHARSASASAASSDALPRGFTIHTSLEGTPGYIAPEVLAGARATVASDLYAVGVILRDMLALASDTARPQPPAELDAIVTRLLCESPAERFASAEEVLRALAQEDAPAGKRKPWKQATVAVLIGLTVATTVALSLAPGVPTSVPPGADSPPASLAAALDHPYQDLHLFHSQRLPVCWENPSDADATERAWVEQAVEQTWEAASAVRFLGWGPCESTTSGIRIRIVDDESRVLEFGSALKNLRNGVHLALRRGASAACPAERRQDCIMVEAVHEFGHVLGFVQAPPAQATAGCERDPSIGDHPGHGLVLPADRESVLDTCNPGYLARTWPWRLSSGDRRAAQLVYGAKDGTITSESGRCLEPGPPGSPAAGLLRDCDGNAGQTWAAENVAMRHVQIVGLRGLCMQAPGVEAGPVVMEECREIATHRYQIGRDGTVRSEADGRCLTAVGQKETALVLARACREGDATQKWRFGSDGIMQEAAENRCVDIWYWGGKGSLLMLMNCHTGYVLNQTWKLRGELHGRDDLCLEPQEAGAVASRPCTGGSSQRWTYAPAASEAPRDDAFVARTDTRFVANVDGDRFSVNRDGRVEMRRNGGDWLDLGSPPGTSGPDAGITPFMATHGDKALFLIARGALFELRQSGASWTWIDHGRPPGCDQLVGTPALAADGAHTSALVLCASGEVVERSSRNRWHWTRHGSPPGRRLSTDQDAGYVIAAVHALALVVDSEGDVWELSGTPGAGRWRWVPHGNPGVAIESGAALIHNPVSRYTGGLAIGADQQTYELSLQPDMAWKWSSHGAPAQACRQGGPPGSPPRYGSGFTMASDASNPAVFGVLRCRNEPTMVRDVFVPGHGWQWVTDSASDSAQEGTPFAVAWTSGGYGVLGVTTATERREWDGFALAAAWAQPL